MKKLLLFFVLNFMTLTAIAQVTTSPSAPTDNEEITITFNATGTNLVGYTGDVYAFTGVTVNGLNWQNIIGGWNDNDNNPQLTRDITDPNVYTLLITPSIFDYYGVSPSDYITELVFVFRSADGAITTTQGEGEDIFISINPTNPPPSTPDNLGISGDATPGWWTGPDLELSFNENSQLWTGNVSLTDGEIKFRFDNSWDLNFGGEFGNTTNNGILVQGGANIPVVAGDYYVKVDLNAMTYAIESQLVEIPDQNFEQALIDLDIDKSDILDGVILRSEAFNTSSLNLNYPLTNELLPNVNSVITDLTGIEAFENLISIACGGNNLPHLDFSSNTSMRAIYASESSIQSINVLNNPNLTQLHLYNNQIVTLNLINNLSLEELIVQSNLITELDLSIHPNLRTAFCTDNRLTSLNIANRNNANFTIPYGAVSFGAAANPDLECIQVDSDMIGNIDVQPWEYDPGVLFSADCGTKPVYVYIPDPNFEQALIDLDIDSDGIVNSYILRSDAENAIEINANFPSLPNGSPNQFADARVTITEKIADLTGIEAFINVTLLGVAYHELTTVDLSNNTKLDDLFLSDNLLTGIDISNNTLLTRFGVMRNPNIGLVDVSKNTLLKELFLENTGIKTIDLTNNLDLWKIRLENNNLTSLNISNNINLEELRCQSNNLTNLDISTNSNLSEIRAQNNGISQINISHLSNLLSLNLSNNPIGSIDVSSNIALEQLYLNSTNITNLDVATNINLSVLYCQYNQLQELDITHNAALTVLECEGNGLEELNVTLNPLLRVLGFGPNNLTEIDVSQNLLLEAIWTNGNNLSSINLDANSALAVIGLSNNPYTYVSLKNDNNANVVYFEAFGTDNLACINADLVVSQSMSNSGKTFSEDCSTTSLAGRWIIAPETGALKVGPEPGSDLWWSLNSSSNDIVDRACYLDDVYEFGSDGSFKNILGDETWLEPWQGVASEQCDGPVAPHDGSVNATYVYDQSAGTITLNGKGAYLGLPKVVNGGELSDPNAAPESIVYNVSFSENGDAMTIIIESNSGVFWTYKFLKESVFIPDPNFEQALVDLNIDSDGLINKRILRSDAETVTELNVNGKSITSLTGIEAFSSLEILYCIGNQLTELNVSQNTALTNLECQTNQFTSLDVSNNLALKVLGCANNLLTEIDVTKNLALTGIWCTNNLITSLNLDLNKQLNLYGLSDNPLEHLSIRNGNNHNITYSVMQNLPYLSCINVDDETADNSNLGADVGITFSNDCGDFVNIPDPNFEQALIDIGIDSDGIVNSAVLREDVINIDSLSIGSPLDATKPFANPLLINVLAKIQDLNGIEAFENLKYLSAGFNDINSIDLSKNLLLEELWINDNNCTFINVSNNSNLKKLGAYVNNLTAIDLSNNPLLTELFLGFNNELSHLNVKNGNNSNILYFWMQETPDLTCISADDTISQVMIDSGKSFNSDCGTVYIPDPNFEQALLDQGIDTDDALNHLISRADAEAKEGRLGVSGKQISDLTGIEAFINITELQAGDNKLTEINLSQNTELLKLWVYYNQLTELDLSNNTKLQRVSAGGNQISSFDSSTLIDMHTLLIWENYITSLDLTNNVNLTWLSAQNNQLIDVNLEANSLLDRIELQSNVLPNINLANNVNVTSLFLMDNPLNVIDITTNTKLLDFRITRTGTSSLDLSNNIALETLIITENEFIDLDLTTLPNLIQFYANNNRFVSIDVSENLKLEQLLMADNPLQILDVSNNPILSALNIDNNTQLASLDMRNENNINIEYFIAENTPNLTCVNADAIVSQVMTDSGKSFSVNCGDFVEILDNNFTDISCNGANNGTINITVTDGLDPYTFEWTNSENSEFSSSSEDLTDLAPGNYQLLLTAGNGSTASLSGIIITEPPLLTTSIANNSTACSNIALVTAEGGTPEYTYLWSNGATSASIQNVPVGTYTVTVTDANGCTTIASIDLTVGEAFNPSASVEDVKCFGLNNGVITVNNANGTAPFEFSKDGIEFFEGEFPYRFDNLEAGTYEIAVRDNNGCTGFITKTVSQPTELSATLVDVQSTCSGQSTGSISVETAGGTGGLSYSWTGSGGYTSSQKNISGLAVGEYTLTVTDNNNCTVLLVADVLTSNEIVVNEDITNVLCKGTLTGAIDLTVSGGSGSGFTYSWTGNITATSEDISNLGSGTNYNVTITDTGSGCTVSKSYIITQPDANLSLNASKTNATGCGGGTITATASGGSEPYEYSIDGTNYEDNLFSGLGAGSFTVWAKDSNGCTISVVVAITDNGKDQYESNNSKRKASLIEIGTTINARIGLATDIDWFQFTPTENGNYDLNLSHPSVNYTFDLYDSSRNGPVLVPTSSTSESKQYALSGGKTYYVQITGALSFDCYDLTIKPSVIFAKSGGTDDTKIIAIDDTNVIDKKEFSVTAWPNPSLDAFNLKLRSYNTDDKVEVYVFDLIGKLVYHEEGKANQDFRFGEIFPSGIYTVKVIQSDKIEFKRLIKE